jgi:paraquat-inducible protein A
VGGLTLVVLLIAQGYAAVWADPVAIQRRFLPDGTAWVTRFHFGNFVARFVLIVVPLTLAAALVGWVCGHLIETPAAADGSSAPGAAHSGTSPAARLPVTRDPARLRLAMIALVVAAALFVPGIFAPCVVLQPRMEGYGVDWLPVLAWLLRADGSPTVSSVAGGVVTLLWHGDWLIGLAILLFSIVFPTLKMAVLLGVGYHQLTGRSLVPGRHAIWADRAYRALKDLGKWSMLDVLVLALLVVAFKTFPMGTRVELAAGAYLFLASVLLQLASARLLGHDPADVPDPLPPARVAGEANDGGNG